MSLSAGRVGVRADQVDSHGRVNSPSFFNEIMEDLPVWTDLPVRVNGTEEVLPSNTSVPVTSPILTDIDYPDIRRNDQYFTYRESPTTVDGLAKIKSIKGNTLVWNQLVKNGNFANTSNWTTANATLSVSSNKATLTVTNNGTVPFYQTINQKTAEHIVLVLFDAYASRSLNLTVNWGFQLGSAITLTTSNQRFAIISTLRTFGNNNFNLSVVAQPGDVINYSNIQLFDLTKMFGAGNEPATVKEFTDLFPMSYYEYNAGSLLNFTGTKIKTVGENHLTNDSTKWGNYGTEISGYSSNIARLAPKDYVIPFKAGGTYTFSYVDNGALPSGDYFYIGVNGYANGSRVFDSTWKTMPYSCTIPSNVDTLRLTYKRSNASWSCTDLVNEIGNRLFFSMVETDSINETELPIETYFPTGMKSAGTVYDELLPTKAITRIGAVDLGTLNWAYNPTYTMFLAEVNGMSTSDQKSGACAVYEIIRSWVSSEEWLNGNMLLTLGGSDDYIRIKNTSYTNANTFKSAMNGVYLYYELATPVELPTLSFE